MDEIGMGWIKGVSVIIIILSQRYNPSDRDPSPRSRLVRDAPRTERRIQSTSNKYFSKEEQEE